MIAHIFTHMHKFCIETFCSVVYWQENGAAILKLSKDFWFRLHEHKRL